MKRSRTASVAGLFALIALFLAVLWLGGVAVGQTTGEAAKSSSEHLNDGIYRSVYKITVVAEVSDYTGSASRYYKTYHLTGVLVREPNVLLTVLNDPEARTIYPTSSRAAVCEQAPDPVRVEARKKVIDEKGVNDEFYRDKFGSLKTEQEKKKAAANIKETSSDVAELAGCVSATIKRFDTDRYRLALIEANEKLNGRVPVFNISDPEPGVGVRAVGFPSAAEFLPRKWTTADANKARLIPSVTSGTVVKTTPGPKDGQVIMHQAPVSAGAWGSPLVNNCGQVAGLNWEMLGETVVKVQGQSGVTGSRSGEAKIDKTYLPTSNVMAAVGSKEVVTFASLNGINLEKVSTPCTAMLAMPVTLQDRLQQNLLPIAVGGMALLLAATALVVAVRRPGPVRNTMIKMFPGMGRSRDEATLQRSVYSDPYTRSGRPTSSKYTPDATTAAGYAARPAAAPTDIIPGQQYAPQSTSGGARLVPIGGGQPVALDAARLDSGGLTFGRESDCDIVSDNSTVSKRHARITRAPSGKLQIEDLTSANGTWRGRTRIQREAFGTGDVVRFGSLEYRVEVSGTGSGPTQLIPSATWVLSGSDERGHPVHWHLLPATDASGRQVETSWIVGRSSEVADHVLSDQRVSAEHAKIRYTPQRGLEICDLGSSNGTKVDGRKIAGSFVAIEDAREVDLGGCLMSISKR